MQADVFNSVSTLRLLGGLLAPYCSMLTYSTRLTEMRRLVNDLIAPIAASLASQKHNQLAKLGCTVEEAPPGSMPADGKGISVAVGSQGHSSNRGSMGQAVDSVSSRAGTSDVCAHLVAGASVSSTSGSVRQRKGSLKGAAGSKGSSKPNSAGASAGHRTAASPQDSQVVSHKRFESGVCCSSGAAVSQLIHASGWPCCQVGTAGCVHVVSGHP